MFTKLYAATWGDVGKAKEKGFFDFDLFFLDGLDLANCCIFYFYSCMYNNNASMGEKEFQEVLLEKESWV